MALINRLKAVNAAAQKLALSHPLARWNKTIAAAVAGVLVFVGQAYGQDAVSNVADIVSVLAVFWTPNAPKPPAA
jgi:hypothetical protein